MTRARVAMNVLAFQAVWLGAVGGAAVGRLWIGPVAALAVVAWYAASAAEPVRELVAVVAGAALGALELTDAALALGSQAAAWAVLLPVSVALAARLGGRSAERAHA